MSKTITLETTLELQTCAACGVAFAAPASLLERLRENHKTYFCPNGHSLWFPEKSDAEKAQAEAEKYKRLWKQEQAYAADVLKERNAAQRSLSATKGVLTRTKTRIANGVCPCCHRSFVNVQKHMTTKHPEYAAETT